MLETNIASGTAKKADKKFEEALQKLLEGKIYTPLEIQRKIDDILAEDMNIQIKRVCCFGRVSTKHEEQESSLFTQRDIFYRYCENKKGYIIVEEIYDRKSATVADKRPKFMDMINRAKRGEFDILLFKDSKRFSRNVDDFINTIEDLKRRGVYVEFIAEGVNSKTATREQLIMLGMMAESHSNNLHNTMCIAMDSNKKRDCGRAPAYNFGYMKPTEKGVRYGSHILLVDPVTSKYVIELFERLRNLEGFASICNDWKERGIKTILGKDMTLHALRRMARNKIYIGELVMNKTYKEDVRDKLQKRPPEEWIYRHREDLRILPDELFYEVQDILDAKSRNHKKNVHKDTRTVRDRMLTGIIKCGCCGTSYIRTVGKKETGYKYFSCSINKDKHKVGDGRKCNNNKAIRQDELIIVLEKYFRDLLENRDDLVEIITSRMKAIIKEYKLKSKESIMDRSALQKAVDDFERAKELYIDGLISKKKFNDYKEKVERLRGTSVNNKISSLDQLNVETVVSQFLSNLEESIHLGMNEDTIDGFKFNSLFDSITANTDGSLVVNFKLSNDCRLVDINGSGCSYHCS